MAPTNVTSRSFLPTNPATTSKDIGILGNEKLAKQARKRHGDLVSSFKAWNKRQSITHRRKADLMFRRRATLGKRLLLRIEG